MEERVASPVSGIHHAFDDTEIQPGPSHEKAVLPPPPGAGVYVVQVPKDQIYRVPPPENALIVERHRNPSPKKRSSCSCFLCVLLPIILILGLIIGIYSAVSYIFVVRSNHPTFHLEQIFAKNSTKSYKSGFPEYTLKMKSENPNDQTILSFQSGGDAYLSYKHEKIAYGNLPEFQLDHKKSDIFTFSLDGAKYKLPADVKASIGDTSHKGKISLTLSINIPMTVKSGWVKSSGSTLSITCNFAVDSLSKASRILSQECHVQG
ncbi:unnamed protein product [Rhodiola kirilowii]